MLTYIVFSDIIISVISKWALSSAGRASALQAGGHRFEPCSAHHLFFGPVVQLVRTLACHARGRGFEPHSGRQTMVINEMKKIISFFNNSIILIYLFFCNFH